MFRLRFQPDPSKTVDKRGYAGSRRWSAQKDLFLKKLRTFNYIFKKNDTFEYFNNYSEFNGLFKSLLKASMLL